MSDSTIDDIKNGQGLQPLQGANTPKSGDTTEDKSGDSVNVSQRNTGITYETFSRHSDDEKSKIKKR